MSSVANKRRQIVLPNDHFPMVLRYHVAYEVVGWGSALMGILILWFTAGDNVLGGSGRAIDTLDLVSLVFGAFWVFAGIYLVLMRRRKTVVFDQQRVRSRGTFGRRQEILWTEVKDVRFGYFSGVLRLSNESCEVQADFPMVGFRALVDLMSQKVDPNLTREALKTIDLTYEMMHV